MMVRMISEKDDLRWRAKDERAEAPVRRWMTDSLDKRKGMVGERGVGKLYAYIVARCCEAGAWPYGLREFQQVFDVPVSNGDITEKQVKSHVKKTLMATFGLLVDADVGLHPVAQYDRQVTRPSILSVPP